MDPEFDKERMAIEGIIDDDVDFHERRIMNESDRDIETETSKFYFIRITFLELSIVVSTLNNAMMAYASVFHFDEAVKCADLIIEHFH
jgi:hypothetical protein